MKLLARHEVAWTRTDLVWALHMLAQSSEVYGDSEQVPAAIAAALDADRLAGLGPALRAVVDGILRNRSIWARTRRELVRLFSIGIDRADAGGVPAHLLHGGDSFGPATRATLADRLAEPGVGEALVHAASLTSPTPSARWARTAATLLPPAAAAVHAILECFTTHGDNVHDDTDVLLRGLTCMAATEPATATATTTRLIERVARAAGSSHPRQAGYPFAPRTAAAAVEILAALPGDGPVRTLARLSLTVKNKGLLARIRSALDRAGAARGWQPGEVHELAVDDHGLDAEGRRRWDVAGYTVVVDVGEGRPGVRFERDGVPVNGVPAAVKGSPELAEARALVKAITATLAVERIRVEALLSQDRTWSPAEWAARYLDHPVTGVLGRRLIWQAETEPTEWTTGFPERGDGGWRLAGVAVAGRVRLWHPVDAGPAEIVAWRDRVAASGRHQPFKQAYREVYRPTPAEEEAGVRSHRYAEHILMYRQASALMRTRGWHADYLGSWDGGDRSEATKAFGGGAWRACLQHHAVDAAGQPRHPVLLCQTGPVWFACRNGPQWTDAPLTAVPARVFSEAMRDVDLFVGVTSIATDDGWAARADDPLFGYWRAASVGPLSARAEVRRDVFARILPKLSIAQRCELQDRYLRVRGIRRTYRIHLGSGNILMEPDDAYLCVVPAKKTGPPVLLPFDDDPMLTLILSKAVLLAADDKITDGTILAQLG
jgi:hypothetical protein